MASVYVTRRLPSDLLAPLRDRHDVDVWDSEDVPVPRDVLERAVGDADGILCMLTDDIDSDLIARARCLRVVSQMAVGVDNIDVAACAEADIVVGHTPGVLTEVVADHAFALLGAIVRRLPEGEKEVRAGGWGPWAPFHLTGGDLHGTTLGVVGMGRIGRAVVDRASGFRMEVVYASRRAKDVAGRMESLDRLLADSDHVILTVALTEETRGLIGAAELEKMKKTGYLVNVSRGPVVDTGALVEALQRRSIAGAALDVTDPEPLPPTHPLLALDNCLVIPHLGSASVTTRRAMAELSVANLLAGLDGTPMPAQFRV